MDDAQCQPPNNRLQRTVDTTAILLQRQGAAAEPERWAAR